ncbi:hypothetical protein GCM10023231_21110 [Olivibacter ginsenosidimutans]|uniref:Lipoprotein n=2 Tax=Olivibacter ginsenosidimutans TaxID=1176537 RepID=A0ABP9BA15_9SPHI
MYPFLVLLCFLLSITACQHRKQQDDQEKDKKQEYVYTPKKGSLVITSETANPEVENISLYGDDEKDSITSVAPKNGKFTLEVKAIKLHEIYFIKVAGKSTKPGTSGLAWEEIVPVLAIPSVEFKLVQKPFNHVGSISKVNFSIQGGGEEQQLLNSWHSALATQEAEEEGQTEEYAIGGTGASRWQERKSLLKPQLLLPKILLASISL